ncbi:unnamed protein product, partial [Polarella glacialis]
ASSSSGPPPASASSPSGPPTTTTTTTTTATTTAAATTPPSSPATTCPTAGLEPGAVVLVLSGSGAQAGTGAAEVAVIGILREVELQVFADRDVCLRLAGIADGLLLAGSKLAS